MVNFEMPLKNGKGYIIYDGKTNTIIIKDKFLDVVEIDVDELIRFTNTNFWKYLSKSHVIDSNRIVVENYYKDKLNNTKL